MITQYWNVLTEFKHYEQYYIRYQIKSQRGDAIISAACIAFSVLTAAGWLSSLLSPLLSAVIISLLQVISAIKPLFPFSKQSTALQYLIPEISNLLLEVERTWNDIYSLSDEKISSFIHTYQSRYNEMDSRITSGIYLPVSKRCEIYAENECKKYFSHRYNV